MKKIKFLSMLLAFALSVGFVSCTEDEDDNNGTVVVPNGTNGTITPGLVNGKRLTGVGVANIEYDEEGRVIAFTDNGYYNDGELEDAPKYIVSYNPFEINFNNDYTRLRVYDVTFTKEGYIKSFKNVYEDFEGEGSGVQKEEWKLSYKDGCLTKVDASGSTTENYDGETFSGKFSGRLNVKWNNGNMTQAVIYNTSNAYGYTRTDTVVYTLTYGNDENTHRQSTPAETLLWGEYIEMLMYLGYFGKSSLMLPKTFEYNEAWIEGDEYYYRTVNNSNCSYNYDKNVDGTLGVIYEKEEWRETIYNKAGDIVSQNEDVFHKEMEYRYNDEDVSAPMESKAVKRSKKSNRRGFLSR